MKQEPTLYREGPPYQRRGSLQLWQFLVTLLDDPANAHFIAWTGRGMEFKLIEPEEVLGRGWVGGVLPWIRGCSLGAAWGCGMGRADPSHATQQFSLTLGTRHVSCSPLLEPPAVASRGGLAPAPHLGCLAETLHSAPAPSLPNHSNSSPWVPGGGTVLCWSRAALQEGDTEEEAVWGVIESSCSTELRIVGNYP